MNGSSMGMARAVACAVDGQFLAQSLSGHGWSPGAPGPVGGDWCGLARFCGESGLLENEPTAPAEQAHTTQRQ